MFWIVQPWQGSAHTNGFQVIILSKGQRLWQSEFVHNMMSGTIGSLLCTYVNVLMCVLKVPAVSCVSGCPSHVVLCISLNVLTCLCKVAHTKTEAWHTPMECSSYNVNMYQYIYKEAIFCMLFVYLDISKDNKKGILNPFVFCVPV